jgi:hypothetical protein
MERLKYRLGTQSRFWVSFLSWIAAASFVLDPVLSSANPADLPSFETLEQKVEFLLAVKQKVPSLFQGAERYEIDLFDLLEDQRKLLEKLNENPDYSQACADKTYLALEIIPPAEGIPVGKVEIRSEAIAAWRAELLGIADQVERQISDPDRISGRIKLLKTRLLQADWAAVESVLHQVGQMPSGFEVLSKNQQQTLKAQQKLLNELNRTAKGRTAVARVEAALEHYDEIRDLIESKPGLSKEVLEQVKQTLEAKNELYLLLSVLTFSHRRVGHHLPVTPQNWELVRSGLDSLNGADLVFYSDKNEVLAPAVMRLLGLSPPGLPVTVVESLIEGMFRRLQHYSHQVLRTSALARSPVKITEVSPSVAIFRGCAGGDCSSRFSFPYPNDPHERVFFIEDPRGLPGNARQIKGYLSATHVIQDGKPALYLITMNGVHVGAKDAELIMRGLEKEKKALGVDAILLPESSRLAGLINFPDIRAVYQAHNQGQLARDLTYRDPWIRESIENYPSRYNQASYDYMDNNSRGVPISFREDELTGIVTKTSMVRAAVPVPCRIKDADPALLLEFLIDLRHSGRLEMEKKVSELPSVQEKLSGMNLGEFFNVLESCQNHGQSMKVEEFKEVLQSFLALFSLPHFLEQRPGLLYPGVTRCWDAFLAPQIEETAKWIVVDAKRTSRLLPEQTSIATLTTHQEALLTSVVFRAYSEHLIQEFQTAEPPVRHLFSDVLVFIRPNFLLEQLLKAEDEHLRFTAAYSLGAIAGSNLKIRKSLVEVLQKDEDSGVRSVAAYSLRRAIDTDAVIQDVFAEALSHPTRREKDPEIRRTIARALRGIVQKRPDVYAALVAALQDEDREVRSLASFSLGDLSAEAMQTHGLAIIQALKRPDPEMRDALTRLLRVSQPTDPKMHFALLDLMLDRSLDEGAAGCAFDVIKALKPTDSEAHLSLARAIGSSQHSVRTFASSLLQELKPRRLEVSETVLRSIHALRNTEAGYKMDHSLKAFVRSPSFIAGLIVHPVFSHCPFPGCLSLLTALERGPLEELPRVLEELFDLLPPH